MKKILFIDRDGTLIVEPKDTFRIDSLQILRFLPGVITWLGKIVRELDYELVMVTNQDGLGTGAFPEEPFWEVQNVMIDTLEREGICFTEIFIDRSFEYENLPTRKPGIGMLGQYINGNYDLSQSYVIGDRITDVKLSKNLGAKSILIKNNDDPEECKKDIALIAESWEEIYYFLKLPPRIVSSTRSTTETKIDVEINLDGVGKASINTGLGFFNHMLEQVAKHSGVDITISVLGDLHIDEHHTVEDTAIVLGEAFAKALGEKKGIERYGFLLPMDDCLAQVALDFGGRNWVVWETQFNRDKIGDMPTELFFHFFKSFSDGAKANLNIKADGENEHHKIEAIFKAVARSIKMAIKRSPYTDQIPTTKGTL